MTGWLTDEYRDWFGEYHLNHPDPEVRKRYQAFMDNFDEERGGPSGTWERGK